MDFRSNKHAFNPLRVSPIMRERERFFVAIYGVCISSESV